MKAMLLPRSPSDIAECEACYQAQLVLREHPGLWTVAFQMQWGGKLWAEILVRLKRRADPTRKES